MKNRSITALFVLLAAGVASAGPNRSPLVIVNGQTKQLPAGDGIAAATVAAGNLFNITAFPIVAPTGPTLNNFDPWAGGTHTGYVEIDLTNVAAGDLTITGIVAGNDGDELYVWNGAGAPVNNPNTISFTNNDSGSTLLDRLWLPNGKTDHVASNDAYHFHYIGGFGWVSVGNGSSGITRAYQFSLDRACVPAALASPSTTTDWNPFTCTAGFTSYVRQDVTGSGTATINGIVFAGPPNQEGRELLIQNISAAGSIAIANGVGAVGNQVITPSGGTIVVGPKQSVTLHYDREAVVYRVDAYTGTTGFLGGSGTPPDLAIWSTSTGLTNYGGTGICAAGAAITSLDATGAKTCTTIASGTTTDLAVFTSAGAVGNYAGSSCGAHTFATSESAAGALSCSTAFDIAGTGLTSSGSTVTVGLNGNAAQACSAGQGVTGLSATGIETCSADVTAVSAGTGISSSTASGTATVTLNINAGVTQTCSAGNAVTSMTATGIDTCSAFPTGSGTTTDITIWSTSTGLGNYAGSTPSACGAGAATTGPSLSAAGVLGNTCTTLLSGTNTDLVAFTSANTVGNYAGSTPSACGAGAATTQPTFSAAGGLTNNCTTLISGTNTDLVAFTGANTIGNFAGSSPAACTGGQFMTRATSAATGALTLTCAAPTGGTGTLIGYQVITATATYTPTTGTTSAVIEMEAGGGAGGGTPVTSSTNAAGGGGSSGSYWRKRVTCGGSCTGGAATIGAAGVASAGANGGNGGDSSLVFNGTTYVSKGGLGGTVGTAAASTTFVAGGGFLTGDSAADISTTQIPGGPGILFGAANGVSGAGGSAEWGAGGVSLITSGAGSVALGNGGGGGGAVQIGTNAATRAGGNGTIGKIIVWEYN